MSATRSRRAATGNTRNGSSAKTLIDRARPGQINAPRDRDGSFEPSIVRKRQRRFEGFDEKILGALLPRGLSTRDMQAHLREIYGVDVGRELISQVTDAVMDDARDLAATAAGGRLPGRCSSTRSWLKIREGGSVQRRACYLALGVRIETARDVLGMWFQADRGRQVLDAGPHRAQAARRQDILICCVDGLNGFPEAIEAIFPTRPSRPASCT